MKVVTAEGMRAIEARCVERGITLDTLMSNAGEAVAEDIRAMAAGGTILILVGPGNNGGDGLVAGSSLQQSGFDVVVYSFNRAQTSPFGGSVIRAEDDDGGTELRRLSAGCAAVVDALLGIGQNRPIEGLLRSIVEAANGARSGAALALSVDIPTGVHTDTGEALGTSFRANRTLCMGLAKIGVFLYPGAGFAGDVQVADVGIPADLIEPIATSVIDDSEAAALLPRRQPEANKGSSGRLLAVSGSRDFTGAPAMVSLAAYRAGAGLVEVALPASIQLAVAAHALEPIYLPLPTVDGKLGHSALEDIASALEKARSLALGPGMGLSESTIELVAGVLDLLRDEKKIGAVVDADGLNALAQIDQWHHGLGDVVVTPHPGEMSRLTGLSIAEVQADRLAVARRFASKWDVVVVLKGARTIVAAPDGRAAINSSGGPNLATAGTGDVLSGIIGGLLAQSVGAWDAARCGVYLHGRAGDLLRAELGDAGTLAGDLLAMIPVARQSILDAQEEDE